eukprot:6178496-Pleurochrysis_carterae.AAC.3
MREGTRKRFRTVRLVRAAEGVDLLQECWQAHIALQDRKDTAACCWQAVSLCKVSIISFECMEYVQALAQSRQVSQGVGCRENSDF